MRLHNSVTFSPAPYPDNFQLHTDNTVLQISGPRFSGRTVPDNRQLIRPGAIRGTEEWDNTYKIRTTVERDINHIKDNLCLAGRRIQNEKTLHADLILAGITQLITVVLSDKINHHEFIRSLKPLIA